MKSFELVNGDSLDVLKTIPDNSVDSVVCDPPYGLSFMGKKWDYDVPSVDIWRECLRVLKPGGHLLAFAGTRTQHRMAVNIEDAGFEIRDLTAWVYGQGFPKSLNINKNLNGKNCNCERERGSAIREHDLRSMSTPDLPSASRTSAERGEILRSEVSQQSTQNDGAESEERTAAFEKSSMEGRGNSIQEERELQKRSLREVSESLSGHGEKGRLRNGTPAEDGEDNRPDFDENRSSSPQRPQPGEQLRNESGTLSDERDPQNYGIWKTCDRCGKPIIDGWGTALKPAFEPITVARKPLIGTVADNVLKYGTGGLNIDGCRIETVEDTRRNSTGGDNGLIGSNTFKIRERSVEEKEREEGRFPANLIHDGSEEVLAAFPDAAKQAGSPKKTKHDKGMFGIGTPGRIYKESNNSAARFFYCAKTSKAEREAGLRGFALKEGGFKNDSGRGFSETDPNKEILLRNNHPTVKPLALMRYLCRLVTPPGGVVVDPFAGSGSTLCGAMLEGFDAIGIEREADYVEISRARIIHHGGTESEIIDLLNLLY